MTEADEEPIDEDHLLDCLGTGDGWMDKVDVNEQMGEGWERLEEACLRLVAAGKAEMVTVHGTRYFRRKVTP